MLPRGEPAAGEDRKATGEMPMYDAVATEKLRMIENRKYLALRAF
jgi:hypothetical protein